MVPSHTGPVGGAAVLEILTVYRDALQYVHDQTVRYMNKGWYLRKYSFVFDYIAVGILSEP